jgi:NADPH2:quinone reductase
MPQSTLDKGPAMPHAIRIHRHGGPEVLAWEEVEHGAPKPGEARVRHYAVGLNYIEVGYRTGLYPCTLPGGLGTEAAGVIEAVGPHTLYITRPSLMPYTAKRADLSASASDLFEIVRSGKVKIEVNERYALEDAAKAHRDLEARRTTGSTLLIP